MKHIFNFSPEDAVALIGVIEKHRGEDSEMDDLVATLRHDISFLEEGEAILLVIRRPIEREATNGRIYESRRQFES